MMHAPHIGLAIFGMLILAASLAVMVKLGGKK